MISDLKQQKIGFQEKIAFMQRIYKKNIYTTQSELGFIFHYFLYNVELIQTFQTSLRCCICIGKHVYVKLLVLDHK